MGNHKLLKTAGIVSYVILSAAAVNKLLFKFSNSQICQPLKDLKYEYSQGKINYKISGAGRPLLLLHDISSSSSMFEWFKVKNKLKRNHTLYAMDWLGCGFSDKPPITYTAFMYIQILDSFIRDIIKKPTDILASGISASYALIAREHFNVPIKKIIALNPADPSTSGLAPDLLDSIKKAFLNLPVIGTSIYNINHSWLGIDCHLKRGSSKREFHVSRETIETMIESSHIGSEDNKYLFASKYSRFIYADIRELIPDVKDLYIIVSEDNYICRHNGEKYIRKNADIPFYMTNGSTKYPQLEYPGIFLDNLMSFYK